jgi:hypothetical protein
VVLSVLCVAASSVIFLFIVSFSVICLVQIQQAGVACCHAASCGTAVAVQHSTITMARQQHLISIKPTAS